MKKQSKFKQLKEAMKNPPPDRLAKIEYRSHFLQILGISAVCILLIIKGYWYIIFALIFGVGVSYSQGMNAYTRYKAIKRMIPEEAPEDFEKDISYTRGRSKMIDHAIGKKAYWLSMLIAVTAPMYLLSWFSPVGLLERTGYSLSYLILLSLIFFILYFKVAFAVANIVYQGNKDKEVVE